MTGPLEGLPDDAVLTSAEVGAVFGVSAKTVLRWAHAGRIPTFFTLGGHRRYLAGDVRRIIEQGKDRR